MAERQAVACAQISEPIRNWLIVHEDGCAQAPCTCNGLALFFGLSSGAVVNAELHFELFPIH